MISEEEYKKTLIRMWDSVRTDSFKGAEKCFGVKCSKCPLLSKCRYDCSVGGFITKSFEIIDVVEKWGKEHPVVTNREKFKELFGKEILVSPHGCVGLSCQSPCDTCPNNGFWDKEYTP